MARIKWRGIRIPQFSYRWLGVEKTYHDIHLRLHRLFVNVHHRVKASHNYDNKICYFLLPLSLSSQQWKSPTAFSTARFYISTVKTLNEMVDLDKNHKFSYELSIYLHLSLWLHGFGDIGPPFSWGHAL